MCAARNGRSRALALTHHAVCSEVLGADTGRGDGESFERDVGEHDRASCRRRQIQAGPAAAGADIEQQVIAAQMKPIGEVVGLVDRRVAVRTPISADDAPFDLSDDVDAFLPVAVGETVARLLLLRQ